MISFPVYKQSNWMDCGPTCLRMIASFYGRNYDADSIRRYIEFEATGVSLLNMNVAAAKMGFDVSGLQLTYEQLVNDVTLPCILHWDQNHFVVLVRKKRSLFQRKGVVLIADPAKGFVSYTKNEVLTHWATSSSNNEEPMGTALLLEPSPAFFNQHFYGQQL